MRNLILLLVLMSGAAPAAERRYTVGSFERLRVDGPYAVEVRPGSAPGASASGDARALDALTVEVNGDTLVVRGGAGAWGEAGSAGRAGAAPTIRLTTPLLRAASVNAGGRVSIGRMAAQRLQLAVNGAGSVEVADADADELTATVIGAGRLTVAGRAQRARLLTNGPGTIDAAALVASDLSVRLDGTGETRANARYTAQVMTTGLGRVTVGGKAKCTVEARAGGPVTCGAGD